MATSGSYDNTTTMAEIIQDAFTEVGSHDPGESLPGEKWTYGKRKLNQLINWLSIHEGLWMRTTVSHTLTPGTDSYTIGDGLTIDTPKPMKILDCQRISSSTSHIPMDIISHDEYKSISNKVLQSTPLQIYYDKQRDNGVLYVWPTGTSTEKTIKFTTSRPIQDFDAQGNNPDLPREWVLLLVVLLAEMLVPAYGKLSKETIGKKNMLLSNLIKYDNEDTSIYIRR